MIRMATSPGGNAAKAYFFGGLIAGDAYFDGQERAGVWVGAGAKYLRLEGPVQTRHWTRLCDNEDPHTGEKLTLRTKSNRRAAFDFTFSLPKGVSYMALVRGDERLLSAAREAVLTTLAEMETYVSTRVRKDGANTDRPTANLLGGLFEHYTSRPVKGCLPDAQLHFHFYAFNATLDRVEAAWKAVELGRLVRALPYFEATFHSQMARSAMALGYQIEGHGKFWEIADVPREVRQYLSKRTEEIHRFAKEHGIDQPEALSGLGAKTRRGKAQRYTMTELVAGWKAECGGKFGPAAEVKVPKGERQVRGLSPSELGDAIKRSSAVLFERNSTIGEARLIEHVLRQHFGRVDAAQVRNALSQWDVIVREAPNGDRIATHQAVVREEKELVKIAIRGRGQFRPTKTGADYPTHFTSGQIAAVEYIRESRNRFEIISGVAGVGKSEMFKVLKPVLNGWVRENLGTHIKGTEKPIEAFLQATVGDKVLMVTPTTTARDRLREDGFRDAETVARLLLDDTLQAKAKHSFVIVDEAGQLGTKQGLQLGRLSEKLDFRLIFVAGTKQMKAPVRGDLVDTLYRFGEVGSSKMDQIVRQKGFMLEVAKLLAGHETERAFRMLDKHGDVVVGETKAMRTKAARAYVAAEKEKKKCGVMCPTHAEIAELTSDIRHLRREAGLMGKGRRFGKLVPVDASRVEKSSASFYKRGMVLRLHQNVVGAKAGERALVLGLNAAGLVLTKCGARLVVLSPMQADNWSVHRREHIDIAEGDRLRITANTRVYSGVGRVGKVAGDLLRPAGQSLANWTAWHRWQYPNRELSAGTVVDVKGFTLHGDIVTTKGLLIPKNFRHWEHGYCETIQSTQSLTFDRGLLWAPKHALGGFNENAFNTAVTRSRHSFTLFSDSKEDVLHAALRPEERLSGLDVEAMATWGRDKDREREKAFEQARETAEEYVRYNQTRETHEDRERE